MSTTTPVRGFKYVLEPVRQQREWKLQMAQGAVAAVQKQLEECEARGRQLEAQCSREAAVAAQAWQKTRDPGAQVAALAYLARLQHRALEAGAETASLREELVRTREACAARQRELETLEEHRESAWRAERADGQRRAAAQADAEWSARQGGAEGIA